MDFTTLTHAGDGEKYFNINWAIMTKCNYACTYCHPDLHNGKIKPPSFNQIENFVEMVFQYCKKMGVRPFFEFGGGEVTLMRWFSDLIWLIKRRGGLVSIISNGSKSLDWWNKNVSALHGAFLSFHVEEVKDKQHFIDVAKIIESSPNSRLQVNIMMKPEQFNECHEFAVKLKENVKGHIALQPLYQGFGAGGLTKRYDYNEHQDRIMINFRGHEHEKNIPEPRGLMYTTNVNASREKRSSFDLLVEQKTNFSGWDCYAGIENIIITFEGKIYRAWCMQDEPIGSIFDEELNLPVHPTVCRTKICQCGGDIASTKTKKLPPKYQNKNDVILIKHI